MGARVALTDQTDAASAGAAGSSRLKGTSCGVNTARRPITTVRATGDRSTGSRRP